MTVYKSLLYLIFEAGLFALYIPLALLRAGPRIDTGVISSFAIPLWLIGSFTVLWCFWDFTFKGRGTPIPMDPPKELVVTGPYRYVRNPIYAGVLSIFLGHFVWFGYWALLVYTVLAFIGVHLFIIFYEEPTLKKKFGAAWACPDLVDTTNVAKYTKSGAEQWQRETIGSIRKPSNWKPWAC